MNDKKKLQPEERTAPLIDCNEAIKKQDMSHYRRQPCCCYSAARQSRGIIASPSKSMVKGMFNSISHLVNICCRWFKTPAGFWHAKVSNSKTANMNREEAKRKIANSFATNGQSNYAVLVEVKGRFLVDNNLVEAWATLRGHSAKDISVPGYTDCLTLLQAESLGLLDFVRE